MPSGERIERDGSAPAQQGDVAGPEHVDLIGLLVDEFGIPRSQARIDLAVGELLVDGEPYTPDPMGLIDRELVKGKTLEVKPRGEITNRTYRFQVAD